jgi:ATP-binding cassette subfamily G (WHITE) protein 2 (PDR)
MSAMGKKDHIVVPLDEETTQLTHSDLVFAWKDVSFSVKTKKDTKALLQGMAGFVKAGEVVAIMGGSGAGKSTLLNVLAGRVGPGELHGDITVNGLPRQPETWRKLCAYVEQDDVYISIVYCNNSR